MVKINSCSSDDGLRSVEMAGLDEDDSRQSGGNNTGTHHNNYRNRGVHVISDNYDSNEDDCSLEGGSDPVLITPQAVGGASVLDNAVGANVAG